jgi:hypothetical protein
MQDFAAQHKKKAAFHSQKAALRKKAALPAHGIAAAAGSPKRRRPPCAFSLPRLLPYKGLLGRAAPKKPIRPTP